MTPVPSARAKYRRSARGRTRGGQPAVRRLAPAVFDRTRFRVQCRRPRGGRNLSTLNLDQLVSEINWYRQGAVMRGGLTLNRRGIERVPFQVAKGDVVRLLVQAKDGAPFRTLWEMEVRTPTHSIAAGTLQLDLRSRYGAAQQTRAHWRFRDDKQHAHGWTADEITHRAARRYKVKLGRVARGTHRIRKLVDKAASVLEIVTRAYTLEREWSGRQFDVSVARGLLEVLELRKPRYMLLMGPELIDAVIDDVLAKPFASALVLTTTVRPKGSKKRRKLRVKVVDHARVRRFGYIERHVNVHEHKIDTAAELRKHGRRLLARRGKPFKTATLTAPGIPWVDRGDGCRMRVPEAGIDSDVYVTRAEHTLSFGSYTMDLTVTVEDPWAKDAKAARVRRKKAEAKRRRQRRSSHAADRPKPKRARVRG